MTWVAAVKICGVTRVEDARLCADAGADFIGLNFWPHSRRAVSPTEGAALAAAARASNPSIQVVGVFVNPTDDEVHAAAAAAGLDLLQLHGDEDPMRIGSLGARAFKATQVGSHGDIAKALAFPGPWVLLDTPSPDYGGSGHVFEWKLCEPIVASGRPWFLAGGLNPENVEGAIAAARPTGVDVASGVESSPGIKDHARVRAFIEASKGLQFDDNT